jgi:protein ImuB
MRSEADHLGHSRRFACEVPRAELRFTEPVADPDDLKRIIEQTLCRSEARGISARRLDLVSACVDNINQAARIGLSRPYREPTHLGRLLADRLVVIDPGFGIELTSLTRARLWPSRRGRFSMTIC